MQHFDAVILHFSQTLKQLNIDPVRAVVPDLPACLAVLIISANSSGTRAQAVLFTQAAIDEAVRNLTQTRSSFV